MSNLTYEAVNWNKPTSELAQVFWDQQWKQIWFNTYPGVYRWMQEQQHTNSEYEETIFGRRMLIPEKRGKHHANTCRINYGWTHRLARSAPQD